MAVSWQEVVNGFGLQRVPAHIAKDLCCDYYHVPSPLCGRALYTDKPLQHDGTRCGYDRMLADLQEHCFCKTHAMWWFSDQIEG